LFSYVKSLSVVSASLTLLVACGPEGSAPIQGEEPGVLGEISSPLWTGSTSEERAPLECLSGRLVGGVDCEGSFCDNVSLDCLPVTGLTVGSSAWTSYFSDEAPNSRTCSTKEWMTGIACQGNYCDRISMKCTEILNKTAVSCSWTSQAYSEEQGPFQAPAGNYLRGIRCNGNNCDQKFYYYCNLQ
jgi:hypothetical protein